MGSLACYWLALASPSSGHSLWQLGVVLLLAGWWLLLPVILPQGGSRAFLQRRVAPLALCVPSP